jgi:hypothetical protein
MDGMGTADIGAARLGKTEKWYLPQVGQITDRVGHLLTETLRPAVPIDADLITRSLGARHH